MVEYGKRTGRRTHAMCLYGATWLGTALLRQQRGPGPVEPGPVAITPITDTARHEPIQLLEFQLLSIHCLVSRCTCRYTCAAGATQLKCGLLDDLAALHLPLTSMGESLRMDASPTIYSIYIYSSISIYSVTVQCSAEQSAAYHTMSRPCRCC